MGLHPTHRTRFSFDASTYDVVCELCGETDMVPGGWGQLKYECPATEEERKLYDEKRRKNDK